MEQAETKKNTPYSISYIIPVRDEYETLGITVKNLISVSLRCHYEIIIVDDNSATPVSEHLDQKLLLHCTLLRNETRLGVAKSRARGAEVAKSEFLMFLDAHVCLQNTFVKYFFSCAAYFPSAIFGTPVFHETSLERFRSYINGSIPQTDQVYAGWKLRLGDKPDTTTLPLRKEHTFPYRVPIACAASMILSKKLYERLGGFDRDLIGYGNAEDSELCVRAWAFGAEVRILPAITVAHYLSQEKLKLKQTVAESSNHPQYDKSEVNAARGLLLHFPEQAVRKYSSNAMGDERHYAEPLEKRIHFVEQNRVWSKQHILRIAQQCLFNPAENSVNKGAANFIFSDTFEGCRNLLNELSDATALAVLAGTQQLLLELRESFPHISCSYLLGEHEPDSLDEVYHFYRGQVWSRAFAQADQLLSHAPYLMHTRIEDALLQYAVPLWLAEDALIHQTGHKPATVILDLKDRLLDKGLRQSELLRTAGVMVR